MATETTTTTTKPADLTCEFQGRTMRIKPPKPEQLTIFKRTLRMIQGMAGQKNLTGEQAMVYFDKSIPIILSILADQHDKEWLEEQFLEHDLELSEAFEIVQSAIDAMTASKAPTSGPVAKKSAARRVKKLGREV